MCIFNKNVLRLLSLVLQLNHINFTGKDFGPLFQFLSPLSTRTILSYSVLSRFSVQPMQWCSFREGRKLQFHHTVRATNNVAPRLAKILNPQNKGLVLLDTHSKNVELLTWSKEFRELASNFEITIISNCKFLDFGSTMKIALYRERRRYKIGKRDFL